MEGQFITANARFQLTILRPFGGILAIEFEQQIEFAPLLLRANAQRRIEIWKRLDGRAKPDALIHGGHEPRPPVSRTSNHLLIVVAQHGESWPLLVLGS